MHGPDSNVRASFSSALIHLVGTGTEREVHDDQDIDHDQDTDRDQEIPPATHLTSPSATIPFPSHSRWLRIGHVAADNVLSIKTTQRWHVARTTKRCTRCSKRRNVEQFHRDKHQKDGLSSWCKGCTREYDRAYRARKNAEVTA